MDFVAEPARDPLEGKHVAVACAPNWCLAKVISDDGSENVEVSHMTPSHGKRKWGRAEKDLINRNLVLTTVVTPKKMTKTLMNITAEETMAINNLFEN